VASIGEIDANLEPIPLAERPGLAEANEVRCPDPVAAEAMRQRITRVMQERDTLGGVLEIVALGLPPGLGSFAQWDRRLEARLGAAVLSVQAIKGVEIGRAFANARLPGTLAQDPIHLDGEYLSRTSRIPAGWKVEYHRSAADRACRRGNDRYYAQSAGLVTVLHGR
jgi:chorismate synthase